MFSNKDVSITYTLLIYLTGKHLSVQKSKHETLKNTQGQDHSRTAALPNNPNLTQQTRPTLYQHILYTHQIYHNCIIVEEKTVINHPLTKGLQVREQAVNLLSDDSITKCLLLTHQSSSLDPRQLFYLCQVKKKIHCQGPYLFTL